jgi:cysteine desulfurase
MIYLDNAATSRIDDDVADYMCDIIKNVFGNPSSVHAEGRKAKVIVDESRDIISEIFGISTTELFFTSGGTEAINTVFRACNDLEVKNIIVGKIEHKAVLDNAKSLESDTLNVQYLSSDKNGIYSINELESLLNSCAGKTMIAVSHVNNELGSINPIKEISDLAKNNNALLFVDTVQSIGKYPLNFKDLGIDFAISSAHKFHGPKGVGFLYVNNNLKINPLLIGGGQEQNMRGGTENVYGIAGMTKAVEIAYADLEKNSEYISNLKSYLISELKSNFDDIIWNSPDENNCAYHILNICFPKENHNSMLIFNLDIKGVAVSGGSACSSGSMKISHVIKEISDLENVIPLRISLSKYNSKSDIDVLIKLLKKY